MSLQASKGNSKFVYNRHPGLNYDIHIKKSANASEKLWIYVCLNWRVPIFNDYIKSLDIADITVSYTSPEQLKLIDYNDSCNYIIPFDITDAHTAGFNPKNTIFINTEPIDENNKCVNIETALTLGFKIVDYSSVNVKLFQCESGNNIDNKQLLYIPYQIRDEELNKLKKLLICEKERDAVTCSYMVPRRQAIYTEGMRKGLNMINIIGYDDKRDEEIAEAKILLNVHQRDHATIFEEKQIQDI